MNEQTENINKLKNIISSQYMITYKNVENIEIVTYIMSSNINDIKKATYGTFRNDITIRDITNNQADDIKEIKNVLCGDKKEKNYFTAEDPDSIKKDISKIKRNVDNLMQIINSKMLYR